MSYDNQAPSQQAQSDEPLFSVAESVVLESDATPCKHLFGILETETMFGKVLRFFASSHSYFIFEPIQL